MLTSVRIISSYSGRHMSHTIAGLLQFCEKSNIPVKFGLLTKNMQEKLCLGFWVQLEFDSGKSVNIYFDMGDWPNIGSFEGLNKCDVYIKRSYSKSIIGHLPKALSNKVVPYGLYFACSTNLNWKYFYSDLFAWLNNYLVSGSNLISNGKDVLKNALRASFNLKPSFIPLQKITNLSRGANTVFYQCRIWDPRFHDSHNEKSLEEINQFRMSLVKNLQTHLGKHFIGGITPSTYSEKNCPDLITKNGHDMNSYLKLLSESKIVVTDNGLHGSAGSKLGEYFAAGKCIVSERLPYTIQPMPTEGEDWHLYEDVNECVEKCTELLNNEKLADESANNAKEFYGHKMAPHQLIAQLISSLPG